MTSIRKYLQHAWSQSERVREEAEAKEEAEWIALEVARLEREIESEWDTQSYTFVKGFFCASVAALFGFWTKNLVHDGGAFATLAYGTGVACSFMAVCALTWFANLAKSFLKSAALANDVRCVKAEGWAFYDERDASTDDEIDTVTIEK